MANSVVIENPVTRPFDPPDTGKLAVKVISQHGDEVLKV